MINIGKILVVLVLCACASFLIYLFLKVKVLNKIIDLANEYGMTPELIKEVATNSATTQEMYDTLNKISASFEEEIIQMAHEPTEE